MPRYDTAANVINRAGKELGLWTTTVSDPVTSTDVNVARLVQLLTSLGQDLTSDYIWPQLLVDGTITGSTGVTTFAVPAGYLDMVPGSCWNRTTRLPAEGPVSSQRWEALKASNVVSTVGEIFRVVHDSNATISDEFEFLTAPANACSIRYQYRCRFWVQTAAGVLPTLDAPTVGTDRLVFDPLLLVRGLKLAWKRETGFDTTAAQQDYDATLGRIRSALSPAASLSLTARTGVRMIDGSNIPETGVGS